MKKIFLNIVKWMDQEASYEVNGYNITLLDVAMTCIYIIIFGLYTFLIYKLFGFKMFTKLSLVDVALNIPLIVICVAVRFSVDNLVSKYTIK